MSEIPSEPAGQRHPVTHEGSSKLAFGMQISSSGVVERGLNEMRLAVLGILVGIGLTVGFGVPGPWTVKVAGGLGSFALACLLVRWRRTRHLLMAFMHWLTDA